MTTKWWVIYASDSLIVLGAVSQSRKKEGTSEHVKNFNQLISNRINILQFKKGNSFLTYHFFPFSNALLGNVI